jgi:HEAT repeat protein
VPALLPLLREPAPDVRSTAAAALGGLRDRRAVESLILLLKDETRTVKLAAALALADIGDKRAVSALNEAVTSERDEETRTQMQEALHRLRAAPEQ